MDYFYYAMKPLIFLIVKVVYAIPLLILSIAGPVSFTAAWGQAIDEVVLVVNNHAITAKEYTTLTLIQNPEASMNNQPVLGVEPTLTIVNNLLLLDRAKELNLVNSFTEQEVVAITDKLALQNSLSTQDFLAKLESQGIDLDIFRAGLKDRLLIERLVQTRIARNVSVTDADVQAFMTNNTALLERAEGAGKTEYELVHLLIALKKGISDTEKERLRIVADDVRHQLVAGQEVSRILSESPDISVSGDNGYLGWKAVSQLPDVFVSALKNGQVGEILPVVSSPNGFHVIKLLNKRGEKGGLKEYQVRHILLSVTSDQQAEEVSQRATNLHKQLLEGASFVALAKQHSEDPGSRVRGGDLGWIKAANMVPAFAEAITSLPVHTISEPIRSQFGFHLIEVLGQREIATKEPSRIENQARQMIFSQRLNEKIEDLVNDLRQVAYIEVVY